MMVAMVKPEVWSTLSCQSHIKSYCSACRQYWIGSVKFVIHVIGTCRWSRHSDNIIMTLLVVSVEQRVGGYRLHVVVHPDTASSHIYSAVISMVVYWSRPTWSQSEKELIWSLILVSRITPIPAVGPMLRSRRRAGFMCSAVMYVCSELVLGVNYENWTSFDMLSKQFLW